MTMQYMTRWIAVANDSAHQIVPHPKTRIYNDLLKAYRIVSELAKVEDKREGETNRDVLWRCNDCIAKCRVIAEEGAKDDK